MLLKEKIYLGGGKAVVSDYKVISAAVVKKAVADWLWWKK